MVRYVPGHSLLSDFGYPIWAIRFGPSVHRNAQSCFCSNCLVSSRKIVRQSCSVRCFISAENADWQLAYVSSARFRACADSSREPTKFEAVIAASTKSFVASVYFSKRVKALVHSIPLSYLLGRRFQGLSVSTVLNITAYRPRTSNPDRRPKEPAQTQTAIEIGTACP